MDNAPVRFSSSIFGSEKNWIPIFSSRGPDLKIPEENKIAEADALADVPINCLLNIVKFEWIT
jgi:hypothetical protein